MLERTVQKKNLERGTGGLKLLIMLYAIGIIGVALPPLRSYWQPYFREAKSTVRDWFNWEEPPRRTEAFERERRRLEAEAQREADIAAAKSNPETQWKKVLTERRSELPPATSGAVAKPAEKKSMDAITTKDKEELDSLLNDLATKGPQ